MVCRANFKEWGVSKRWMIPLGLGVIVLGLIAVVIVVAAAREPDGDRRPTELVATSTTSLASPYDLTELPAGSDLGLAADATFVSISLVGKNGRLTSYGIDAEKPAARDLIDAVDHATEVDAETTAVNPSIGSMLVFVLPTRETLTFALDLERGLVSRSGRVWKPDGDLRALVDSATTGP
ncbi:MAG: hypothetical protein ABH877_04250 [bacterium]